MDSDYVSNVTGAVCSSAELTGSAETAGGQDERGAHSAHQEDVRPGQTISIAGSGWSLALDRGTLASSSLPEAAEEGGAPIREDGKISPGDALFTASAFPCKDGAQVIWIADTVSANYFCCRDTLPGDVFEGMRPCPDVCLATANSIIEPEGQLEVYLTDLCVDARFLVLKDCPPVLSIGRLVEQHGFKFHWEAGKPGSWFLMDDATYARSRPTSPTSTRRHLL